MVVPRMPKQSVLVLFSFILSFFLELKFDGLGRLHGTSHNVALGMVLELEI